MSDIKTRTITLTDRPPVTIREDQWPWIAEAKWWAGGYEFQANRTATIRIREHADGRRLVYGVTTSQWEGERGLRVGRLIDGRDGTPDTAETIRAIHEVADAIGHPALAAECIADLPAETI